VPIEDVLSRVTEIAALASRVSDPSTMRAAAGDFSSALSEAPPGPAGHSPDALPWMAGGASLPQLTSYVPTSYTPAFRSFQPGDPTLSGLRTLLTAAGEIGVQEEPPGSNDGPRIAQYRAASAGAAASPGPWCAYFVSWAGAQALLSVTL